MINCELLKEFRKSRGLTQGALADLIGKSTTSVWNYEHRRPIPVKITSLELLRKSGYFIDGLFGDNF